MFIVINNLSLDIKINTGYYILIIHHSLVAWIETKIICAGFFIRVALEIIAYDLQILFYVISYSVWC